MPVLVLAAAAAIAIAPAPPPSPACAAPQTALTSQTAPMQARKLGDLPDAEMDLAVIRSVGGCWVREVTRTHVSQRGPIGAPAPIPTPGFRGALVPDGPIAGTTPAAGQDTRRP